MQLDKIISSGMVYFLISSVVGLVYYGTASFAGMLLLAASVGEGRRWARCWRSAARRWC